jgi:hypothetical protein
MAHPIASVLESTSRMIGCTTGKRGLFILSPLDVERPAARYGAMMTV